MRFKSQIALLGIVGALSASLSWQTRAEEAARLASKGIYTAEQAGTGKAIYTAQCAACHGGNMAGIDVAPPLKGSAFLSAWSGKSVSVLDTRIRRTMPPDKPGSLNLDQAASVTAYILGYNGFPAGKTPLPSRPADQRSLIIDQLRR